MTKNAHCGKVRDRQAAPNFTHSRYWKIEKSANKCSAQNKFFCSGVIKREQKAAAQGGVISPFGCADPYPIQRELSIILVAFDWDFSLTLSGCPALCVRLYAPIRVTQHQSLIPFPLILSSSYERRFYRAFASYD